MIGFFCRHSLFDRIKLWRNKIEDDGVKFLVVNEVKRNSFLYEKTFNYDLDERRLATLPHLWIISSRRWKNEDSISLSSLGSAFSSRTPYLLLEANSSFLQLR